jgi:hypothetical protein
VWEYVPFSGLSGCAAMMRFFMRILYSYLQVIFTTTYWTWFWTILQKEKDRLSLKHAFHMLESEAVEVCAKHRWLSYNKLNL